MSAPLYFLPGIFTAQLAPGGKLSRSLLAARGLGEVFEDVRELDDLARIDMSALGPGNQSGMIISALPVESREPPRRIGYYPQDPAIEWHSFDNGSLWIAIDTQNPPTPADLARSKQLQGHAVEMADGQQWIVPVLRRWPSGSGLPQDWEFDDAGQFVQRIKARYRQLWDRSAWVHALHYDAATENRVDLAEALQFVLDCLALNYRIGRNEQRLCHLVDTTNWETALGATVDLPKVMQALAQKKTETEKPAENGTAPPSANSGPGSTADSPATGPAAATSSSLP